MGFMCAASQAIEAQCPFKPDIVATATDKYLRRMGRTQPVTADDLLRFREEKLIRDHQRRLIVDEVTSKELTFKPQINLKSLQLQV